MWRHIRRSPYQAFAAVLIISQTFFVISIFSLILYIFSQTITYFESKPQVTAFFKNEAKQENIDAVKDQVMATGKVTKLRFVSKQEALNLYKQQNKDDDPLLLDLVSADVLPASLEVSTQKLDDLSTVFTVFKDSVFIQKVVYQKDIISILKSWTDALRRIGAALIIVLAIDSVLIMVIIIGIKISQRRDEIEIMQLIGATKWYVRWPFLYEGVLYGIVGAFLGWTITMAIYFWSMPFLSMFLKGIPVLPIEPRLLFALLGFELVLAVVLGVFSSFLAVLRYLK